MKPGAPERYELGDSRRLHLAMPTQEQVRALECPTCREPAGKPCMRGAESDLRWPPSAVHHRARVLAARQAMKRKGADDAREEG